MSRNVQLLVLRGVFANIPSLGIGEFYFATDSKIVYIGTSAGNKAVGPSSGLFLKQTVLTSGTSFTTGALTTSILIRMIGAGGAGGGATASSSTAASAGGGGAAGSYAEKLFTVTPNTSYAYTIGAAGTGVSGANGNNGGNTTFTVSGVTVTAPGGRGGVFMATGTSQASSLGGVAILSTNGDVNSAGAPGGISIRLGSNFAISGFGGSSIFGTGGAQIQLGSGSSTASGLGFGSGGAGVVLSGNQGSWPGGNGTLGLIVVYEYS